MAGDAKFHSSDYHKSLRRVGGAAKTAEKLKAMKGKAGEALGNAGGLLDGLGDMGIPIPSINGGTQQSGATNRGGTNYNQPRISVGGSGQGATADTSGGGASMNNLQMIAIGIAGISLLIRLFGLGKGNK